MRRVGIGAAVLAVLALGKVLALGPHQLLVVANADSPASVEVARHYAALRQVPEENCIRVPLGPYTADATLDADDFLARLYRPVEAEAAARGLAGHVLAWALSCDIPTRVRHDGTLFSVTGALFLRGHLVPGALATEAEYVSPLYGGPEPGDGRVQPPLSLDVAAERLGERMPLPAMMLAVTGEGALTTEAAQAVLRRGLAADGRAPTGTVYLVTGSDVRAQCRQDLFRDAARELAAYGVGSLVTSNFPAGATDVAGLMMGAAAPDPSRVAGFLPGAFADHLTSFAGVFGPHGQTRLTAWLEAGATASAGTVTEPMARWPKFANARFFVYQAAGCGMLEAYAQSVRCPLQLLPVGDPLAAPWAPRPRLALSGVPARVRGEAFRVRARVLEPEGVRLVRYTILVDGRPVADTPETVVETAALAPGPHRVRAVAGGEGPVRVQAMAEVRFEVD